MITIGIIEDDDKIRREFQEYFAQSTRFKCVIAACSVEKFQKYYRSDDANVPLRLLMLDINLPGMSGLDAIEGLKRTLPPDADIIVHVVQRTEHDFQGPVRRRNGLPFEKPIAPKY